MFFKFEIQTNKEGVAAAVPVGIYEDAKSAEVAYHNAVAYNLQSELLNSFLVMIITDTGAVTMKQFYNFAIPTPPEPEPTPDPEPEG